MKHKTSVLRHTRAEVLNPDVLRMVINQLLIKMCFHHQINIVIFLCIIVNKYSTKTIFQSAFPTDSMTIWGEQGNWGSSPVKQVGWVKGGEGVDQEVGMWVPVCDVIVSRKVSAQAPAPIHHQPTSPEPKPARLGNSTTLCINMCVPLHRHGSRDNVSWL